MNELQRTIFHIMRVIELKGKCRVFLGPEMGKALPILYSMGYKATPVEGVENTVIITPEWDYQP